MLKILVSYVLGPWGLKVLYFYLENAAIINSVVFAYGIFLALAHHNFTKILDHLIMQLQQQTDRRAQKKIKIDIQMGISEAKSFPYISGQFNLFPKKANKKNVLKFLDREKRWLKLVRDIDIIYL